MTINEARTIIESFPSHTDLVDSVKEWANCQEADIVSGDIWIANPQTGHWLSEDKLIEFAEWREKQ